MHRDEIKTIFDQQASGYERQQEKLAPIREGLHFLLESVLADQPADARILCVGVGTGAELKHLAKRFPGWHFTALDPSGAMLNVCRNRAAKDGYLSRCSFHEGYLDSLPNSGSYDAATCFMVSQFILETESRCNFFRSIGDRLKLGGILASSDLSSEVDSHEYNSLTRAWMNMLFAADVPNGAIERTRIAWDESVAILPPEVVSSIISSGGFDVPVQFYQAGLIRAWFSKRV